MHWPTPFPTATRLWSGLLHHTADLIILDVYMPRMTGLELLRTLRMEGIGIDVIMVTAANDSKTVDALLKLGVTDYLVKPLPPAAFSRPWIPSVSTGKRSPTTM
ncbi:MAG: response regulator [Oscillospiraceae bacterium]